MSRFLEPARLAETLRDLIRCRSDFPRATEAECCRYVAQVLEREGIAFRTVEAAEDRPNIYAAIDGRRNGPTVILNGHMDVVPADEQAWMYPPFDGLSKDGMVFGRGAADMKGGLASMLHAFVALKRAGAPFRGRVILFFNVDEERTNLGMYQFLAEDIEADFAIIAEPTENILCLGHRGAARYVFRTRGTPEHAAWAKEPNNAIEKMAELIRALKQYRARLGEEAHPFLGPASACVTLIEGGQAANIVPSSSRVIMDRRLLPGETPESVQAHIRDFLRAFELEYELEQEFWLDASMAPDDHPLILKLRTAIEATGGPAAATAFPASCEAPFFSSRKGIPTAIFGPGSIAQAHVTDEFVRLHEVHDHCKTLVRFFTSEG